MRDFDGTHLLFLAATLVFWAVSSYAVSKMSRKWQNVMFVFAALMAAGGIFFRYGMGMNFDSTITLKTLALQQMQVCNFNFLLVMLMLVPRFELARQYSAFFSMFAAFTTLVSIPNVWANYSCFDWEVLNSWLNHTFDIALPMWMIAARRLKPRREYVLPVAGCVFGYFTVVAFVSTLLIKLGVMTSANSYSFVFTTDGIGIFEMLRSWIPLPYFYLWPLFPVMVVFFYLWAWAFRKYGVQPFALPRRAVAAKK